MAITALKIQDRKTTPRHWLFVLIVALSLALLWTPIWALGNLVLRDERYTYIGLVPFISIGLIYLNRQKIFDRSSPALIPGALLILIGGLLAATLQTGMLRPGAAFGISLAGAAMVAIWIGAFVLCYGLAAFRAAVFPLVFFVLIVPLPSRVMEIFVVWLQQGSAEVSYILFNLVGVPVLRHGFTFSLPGLDIEVAEQCSGIRSSISLFIASILAGQLILHSAWKKTCLVLLSIPIVIAKNSLRIVVLSLLGAYVDRGILFGTLHKSSGLLFSPLALLVLAWLLSILYKSEKRSSRYNLNA